MQEAVKVCLEEAQQLKEQQLEEWQEGCNLAEPILHVQPVHLPYISAEKVMCRLYMYVYISV
eukprot:1161988-Pelagomonas_calceolata.AAC.6